MKRTAFAAALFLLAACETNLPGEGPYEPAAPAPYPPAGPYQPPPPECPITASREWTAWVNRMPGPGSRAMLVVTGKVDTATGGYQVALDHDMRIAESYPAQAFITLHVADPETPNNTQVVVTHEVRWEWPLSQPIGSVMIRCGDKTLAEITKIQTAY